MACCEIAMPRALIVGASPTQPSVQLLQRLAGDAAIVIACDGGVDACMKAGVGPDVVVGDLDSASEQAIAYAASCDAEFLRYPKDKDAVDFALAVDYAREWMREQVQPSGEEGIAIIATGISGGRLDHWLGVLGCLVRAEDCCIAIWEDEYHAVLLAHGFSEAWHARSEDVGHTLSVISFGDCARVSERGTRWEVADEAMRFLDDRFLSNVIERPDAWVQCHEGKVLVVIHHDI